MTSADTLLPCPVPWCGSDVLEVVRSPWSRGYCITCQSCGVQSPSRETEAEATAAWNRRTTPTPATDEREAVARALCIAGEEDDFNYKGYLELADAALSTLAQIRAAEILAAEARGAERERAAVVALANTYVWQHVDHQAITRFKGRIERNEHGAGK